MLEAKARSEPIAARLPARASRVGNSAPLTLRE